MQELVSSETLNNEEEIIVFEENLKGPKGENGATFTPNVSKTGNLSWTNDKNLENPETVNIRGPQGPQGIQGPQGLQGDKGEKGDDGYTPVKGTDYFTEADQQEFIEAVTEDASSNFVQTVSEKTTEFNNNATSKTNAFNSNATSKETSYNENATLKLNEYNENHTTKLNAYNENATAKIAEYDEHIEDLDNIVSKTTVSGESILIDDALAYKIFGAKIDGNTSQKTTTGANLLENELTSQTVNGVTFTINEDKSITANGTATSNIELNINSWHLILQAGTYYIKSGATNSSSSRYYFEIFNGSNRYISDSSGNGRSFTLDAETTFRAYIAVKSGITLENIKFYPMICTGSEAKEYEQFTGGEPSPNPDYPQNISIVSDEVKIVQTGKNLFSKKLNAYGAISPNINVDSVSQDTITISATSETSLYESVRYSSVAKLVKGKTYTVSAKIDGNENSLIRIAKSNDGTAQNILGNVRNNAPFTFTYDGSYSQIGMFFYVSHGVKPSAGSTATFSEVMIEESSSMTEYEAYKSNEYTIDLNDNELVKLTDDIKDTIEISQDGKVSLSKKVGKTILNGTESWALSTLNDYQWFRYNFSEVKAKAILMTDYLRLQGGIGNWIGITTNSTSERLYVAISDEITTVEQLKAWLSENNVTVYYELAELTTSNLGQLTNFKTFASVNHFFLEANLATNFEIKYAQDLQKVISKQQEEINELKTLLSSKATSAMLLDNYANDLMEEV